MLVGRIHTLHIVKKIWVLHKDKSFFYIKIHVLFNKLLVSHKIFDLQKMLMGCYKL
jgi:hypothetical protein